jgi:hypothetical protein
MTTPQGYSLADAVQDPLLLTISMSSAILSTSPLLLLSALLMTPAFAQQMVAPVPAAKSEYTSVNDKVLYIRGGYNSARPVQQFYSLDLTPLLAHSNKLFWKYLNPGGPIQKFQTKMPMAVLNNNQKLTYFNENGMMADYNLQADRWDDSAKPICPATFREGVKAFQTALLDPKTNLVYIPFGTGRQEQMLVHDTSTNSGTKCSGVPMPTNSEAYLFAWSDSKSTIYMLGNIRSATKPILWEFQFATKTWKEIVRHSPHHSANVLMRTKKKKKKKKKGKKYQRLDIHTHSPPFFVASFYSRCMGVHQPQFFQAAAWFQVEYLLVFHRLPYCAKVVWHILSLFLHLTFLCDRLISIWWPKAAPFWWTQAS